VIELQASVYGRKASIALRNSNSRRESTIRSARPFIHSSIAKLGVKPLASIMASSRRNVSITLPRNFTFHYTDGQGPKTPEPTEVSEPKQPSPPRVRQPARAIMPFDSSSRNFARYVSDRDVPIPSIETQLAAAADRRPSAPESSSDDDPRYLSPPRVHSAFTTPPRTPVPQLKNPFEKTNSKWPDWSLRSQTIAGNDISRPHSVLSNFSDSSAESNATSTSYPSFGSSTTTPEGDLLDPFADRSTLAAKGKSRMLHQAIEGPPPLHLQPRPRRMSTKANWTNDTDQHLWQTYLLYIQDPTVTPFRTQPGCIPPLGVCEKVSRYARATWKGPKLSATTSSSTSSRSQEQLRSVFDEANAVISSESDRTISGRTPVNPQVHAKWGHSIGKTRKRLRELCARKAAPTATKARMLSPGRHAPFQAARFRLFSPARGTSPGFDTRDIDLSLSTSIASTMKPNGVLANFAREQRSAPAWSSSDDWFGQPLGVQHGPHDIAPLDFGLGIAGVQSSYDLGHRLGSPFHEDRSTLPNPVTPPSRTFLRQLESNLNTIERHANIPNHQIFQPSPVHSALKRPAPTQFEDELSIMAASTNHNLEQDIFGFSAPTTHRRVRSRGFSLGAVSKSSQLSNDVLTPPAANDLLSRSEFAAFPSFDDSYKDVTMTSPNSPNTSRMKRLGSPFAEPLTSQSLASHINEGSSSSAFSIATFPRPERRKYTRRGLDTAFGDISAPFTVSSSSSSSSSGPRLPQRDLQQLMSGKPLEPSLPPTEPGGEEEDARRKRMRG
jgi:hypothetical protein